MMRLIIVYFFCSKGSSLKCTLNTEIDFSKAEADMKEPVFIF